MFKKEINNYNLELFVPSFTSDMLGFASIALVSLVTLLVAIRWPNISKIIFTALILRVILMIFGHYFFNLPDSTNDAQGFEWGAWDRAQEGFFNTIKNFPGANSFFYSWFISIPYSLFGRSILMMQSIGLFFGLGVVFLGWFISRKIWDESTAIKVGWLLAIFPSLILYSIVPLREVYNSFFLIVAMIGIINWTKTKSLRSIILTLFGFIGASFFHGVLLIGSIIFLLFLGYDSFKIFFRSIIRKRLNTKNFLIISLCLIIIGAVLSSNLRFQYVGTLNQGLKLAKLQEAINVRMKGNASYSEWTRINSPVEILYKMPARALYFLFSPLPWHVKKPTHWIGVFDSILYIFLAYLIFLNRKKIWNDPALRIILIILITYILVFSIGVSNFGAGARHRTKFVAEMIILAAPMLPKLTLSKKSLRNFLNNL